MINMEWTWHDWRLQRRDEKPCPIPSWNVAHRNAKCRSLSHHIRGHLMYASLSSISNLRWFSFNTILGSSTLLLLLLPMLLPSLSSLSVSAYVYAPVLMGNSGQVFCGLWGLLILNGDTRLEWYLFTQSIGIVHHHLGKF